MMMMMLATGVMLFATPYLMASMDKETLEEVKQKQGKMLAAKSSISNMDISSLKSLLGGDSENRPQSTKPTAETTSSVGKGKAKAKNDSLHVAAHAYKRLPRAGPFYPSRMGSRAFYFGFFCDTHMMKIKLASSI